MKTASNVTIIIVNFKTGRFTVACLQSLFENRPEDIILKVVVADNDSGDGSYQTIKDEIEKRGWQSWASVRQLARNGGFAYGNNRIIETALTGGEKPDYIWLLNPDTIVKPGAIVPLVDYLNNNQGVGIVGSRLEGPQGDLQVSSFRDHSIMSEFLTSMRLGLLDSLFSSWIVAPATSWREPQPTDWVSGASIMVRREVFEQIGMLDEGFFMYYEEADFCRRAREKGWLCCHVPASRVIHLVGAASGIDMSAKKQKRRPLFWFESRRRYFLKNHGALTLFFADLAVLTGYLTWRIRRKIQGKPDHDPPHYLSDFLYNSFFFKGFTL